MAATNVVDTTFWPELKRQLIESNCWDQVQLRCPICWDNMKLRGEVNQMVDGQHWTWCRPEGGEYNLYLVSLGNDEATEVGERIAVVAHCGHMMCHSCYASQISEVEDYFMPDMHCGCPICRKSWLLAYCSHASKAIPAPGNRAALEEFPQTGPEGHVLSGFCECSWLWIVHYVNQTFSRRGAPVTAKVCQCTSGRFGTPRNENPAEILESIYEAQWHQPSALWTSGSSKTQTHAHVCRAPEAAQQSALDIPHTTQEGPYTAPETFTETFDEVFQLAVREGRERALAREREAAEQGQQP